MVSIKKAKQGFSLRRRNGINIGGSFVEQNKEMIALIVAGVCIGVLVIVLWQSMGTDKEVTQQKLAAERQIHHKPHPILFENDNEHKIRHAHPMSDTFNAMALDILETLDCVKLFETTLKSEGGDENGFDGQGPDYGNGNGGGGIDDDVEFSQKQQQQQRRRRLDDQHGDDGGFPINGGGGGDGGGNGNSNAGKADDDDDQTLPEKEENWGNHYGADKNKIDDQFSEGGGGIGGPLDDAMGFGNGGGGDMDYDGSGYDYNYVEITAQHLFCLAATQDPPNEITSQIMCDATNTKRKTLLELWSSARAQMTDKEVLLKTLKLAREHSNQLLLGKNYNLWAPSLDDGMSFMLGSLNSEKDADNGGIHGLHESLDAPDKIFVDIGSCLGLTCLAIHDEYPNAKIISIEPAFPNWLYQELNVRCNIHDEDSSTINKKFKIIMSGVGPNTEDEDYLMAKFMWRPKSTTSTRAWTPRDENGDEQQTTANSNNIELVVRLQQLKRILAGVGIYDIGNINVLNIDCEGCEYNVIPALTDDEFEAIPTVIGGVHWGYIPTSKLPSSERGRQTHERLCSHENIAKSTKECCAFLDIPVKSSVPGEVLIRDNDDGGDGGNSNNKKKNKIKNNNRIHGLPQISTVRDVIDDGLCDDFEEWVKEHYLNDVMDDWGWMELTSQA